MYKQTYISSHITSCFQIAMIEQKGMYLNHDFYVVVGKKCRHRKYLLKFTKLLSNQI